MTSLTVWSYPTLLGVDAAELRLKQLEESGGITVHDLVTVIWPATGEPARVRHRLGVRHDVLGGTAWGTLVGALVGGPVGGAAVGAVAGAARNRRRGHLIDSTLVSLLRKEVRPGTSAMCVLSSGADVEAVLAMIARDDDASLLHHESDTEATRGLLDELARHRTDPESSDG